jgi:hypothetical protein
MDFLSVKHTCKPFKRNPKLTLSARLVCGMAIPSEICPQIERQNKKLKTK